MQAQRLPRAARHGGLDAPALVLAGVLFDDAHLVIVAPLVLAA
jgi:hypothetical protein